MAEDKTKKPEELSEEQLNDVSGGNAPPKFVEPKKIRRP